MNTIKKTVYVQWMDCISCETVLRDALDAVPSIQVLSLTHKTWKMTIEYTSPDDLHKLEQILHQHEYTLIEEDAYIDTTAQKNSTRIEQFAIWGGILALLRAVTQIDLTHYLWDYGPTMGLWVAFLVWLVACSSSCLAVTGGIIVSYVEALEDQPRASLVKTQWLFHLGRMLAFVWGGALLWHLGQTIQISSSANAIMMMVVWLILAYVGLQTFGIVPSITKRWFHLPWWAHNLIKKFNEPRYALLVWALTFFLPCWFTQSMQLFAMQTGSAMQWALMLWAYWLWTVPLLLWLWLSAWYFKTKLKLFNRVIAGLLVAFGLITFANWRNASQWWLSAVASQWQVQWNIEQIAWKHTGSYLEPKDILLTNNKSYAITITPSQSWLWCKSFINLPDGTNQPVKKWEPITFAFNPTQAGTYKLLCDALSPHGSIVVE